MVEQVECADLILLNKSDLCTAKKQGAMSPEQEVSIKEATNWMGTLNKKAADAARETFQTLPRNGVDTSGHSHHSLIKLNPQFCLRRVACLEFVDLDVFIV